MKKYAIPILAGALFLNAFPALAQEQTTTQAQATAQTTQEQPTAQEIQKNMGSFTVYPAKPNAVNSSSIIAEIKPGGTYEETVIVENKNDYAATLTTYAVDGTTAKEGGFTVKMKNDIQENIGLWAITDPTEIEVAARQKMEVKITITVPENAAMGEYRGGFVAEATKETSSTIVTTLRVAMPIQVTVTANPQIIPRMAAKQNIFQNYYLWASLGIFVLCMAYFFWTNHKEKKHKKHAAHNEHAQHHGHTGPH